MSYLYDTVEPTVISDDLLMENVEDQGPVGVAGKLAKDEGIDFWEVFSLRLDYKNILRIDGMWEFVNLTKLQMDNNIIERIEGLEKLVNLVWLDLSFNNIEVIEGLDTLTKLEDLSLFNNHIARIENMDKLVNLQIFSIGNNDLKDLDNLFYLRPFKKNLRTLSLSNNPFCKHADYKLFVGAYLPFLEFLDYRLLDDQTRTAGYEKFQLQIDTILDDEKAARIKEEEAERKAKEFEYNTKALMEKMTVDHLFDSLYEKDPEGQLLNEMPDKLNEVSEKIFKFGVEEYENREAEVALFWECVNEAKQENKEEGMKILDDFQLEKKRIFREISVTTDPKVVEDKVNDFHKRATELWDKLMGLEMTLVDQLEEVIQLFDRNLQDIVAGFLEQLQGLLASIREAEDTHNERVLEQVQVTSDLLLKGELDDIVSDELKQLFVDKDTVSNAVQTSHDTHMLKIDHTEDDIVGRIKSWMDTTMKTIHEEQEIKRNRDRVIEICRVIDHFREEIDNLEMVAQ
ncbi:dynein regulatory complex subunit 3-like [Babylonia areolata]|uniref:dynein regulatory complex subunit 3-like n=1 Tax=Babylonia areolata TaxID=304850 RepID=UPI003FCF8949